MGRQTGKLPLDNCCSECKLGHKELDTTERLRTHVHMQRGGAFLEAEVRSSFSDILGRRCLLDVQVEMCDE